MLLCRRYVGLLMLLLAALPAACGGSDNSPTAPTTPPPQGPADLQITDLVVGTGDPIVTNQVVTVSYTLWLYDPAGTDSKGTAIEQNAFQFRTGTGATIAGFEQGVLGMRLGGTRRLIIPPNLAYGSSGSGPIPANSWIVFEVTVLQITA